MANAIAVLNPLNLRPEECVYTKCYCEENVWKLCQYVKDHQPTEVNKCYCVFISNTDRTIPLWQQKASQRDDTLVVWDYHVIFIYKPGEVETQVYDLDTLLPFPSGFLSYVVKSIRPNDGLQPSFHRSFRVIPAALYLLKFASDRSHMLDEHKKYMSSPPSYPCIQTDESKNNIQDFISMDQNNGYGSVKSFQEFVNFFINKSD